ncbi:uncharacterized protein V2V93DRAFT_366060 [Kockiozyma suomiensis]|uniref:uncharacterized protein n=1 Tax=Kockiozyma suomiensis TaxID=1337062 RepID=UPI003342FF5F
MVWLTKSALPYRHPVVFRRLFVLLGSCCLLITTLNFLAYQSFNLHIGTAKIYGDLNLTAVSHGERLPSSESVFVMVKTGMTVLWQRLPVHLNVTFPQLAHYGIYSDAPARIGDIPVTDILVNVSRQLHDSDQFESYRRQRQILKDNPHIKAENLAAQIQDAWWLDRYKNLPMIAHAYRTMPDAKWYVFIDGDTFVSWSRLFKWLATLDPDEVLYMGSAAIASGEYFAHGGSGVILSSALVKKVFGNELNLEHKYDEFESNDCCGDHVLAHVLLDRNIPLRHGFGYPHVDRRIQGEPPRFVYLNPSDWCREIISFHHLDPVETQQLYDFEGLFGPNEPILYRDVYRHFVMPHLHAGRKANWDNGSDGPKFYSSMEKDASNPQETAYKSHRDCRKKCDSEPFCLQFKYKPDCCILSNIIRLGESHYEGGDSFSSEWNIGKIRAMRQKSGCDTLDKAEEEGSLYESIQ